MHFGEKLSREPKAKGGDNNESNKSCDKDVEEHGSDKDDEEHGSDSDEDEESDEEEDKLDELAQEGSSDDSETRHQTTVRNSQSQKRRLDPSDRAAPTL